MSRAPKGEVKIKRKRGRCIPSNSIAFLSYPIPLHLITCITVNPIPLHATCSTFHRILSHHVHPITYILSHPIASPPLPFHSILSHPIRPHHTTPSHQITPKKYQLSILRNIEADVRPHVPTIYLLKIRTFFPRFCFHTMPSTSDHSYQKGGGGMRYAVEIRNHGGGPEKESPCTPPLCLHTINLVVIALFPRNEKERGAQQYRYLIRYRYYCSLDPFRTAVPVWGQT